MGKSAYGSFHINDQEGMTHGAGSLNAESGMGARLTSFIMAWLLAIFFCLAFWFGIYLLIRSFVSSSSWQV